MASAARKPVLQRALVMLVLRALRPVARIALRHGMSCLEFEDVARWVFVDVALHDPLFALPGRGKQFKSRAAILTGLSRKEVMRLARQAPPHEADLYCRNRAARVVAGWSSPPYADPRGNPRVLSLKDGEDSFARLVRSCGGDVPHRAILDELTGCGAVERLDGDRLRLKSPSRLLPRTPQASLERAAIAVDGALSGVERQLQAERRRTP